MHAIDVAILLGIQTVVVPTHPGTTSAYGLLAAEFKNDYARTFPQQSSDYDLAGMARVFAELEREGTAWLDGEGVPPGDHVLAYYADLRYAHQGSELTIPYSGSHVNADGLRAMLGEFHQQHEQLYGFSLDQPVEIVTLRVTAAGQVGRVQLQTLPSADGSGDTITTADALIERRPVYFHETSGFVECPIYDRAILRPNSEIDGPAILEGMDSTVVINPGWRSRTDRYGNCIIRAEGN